MPQICLNLLVLKDTKTNEKITFCHLVKILGNLLTSFKTSKNKKQAFSLPFFYEFSHSMTRCNDKSSFMELSQLINEG